MPTISMSFDTTGVRRGISEATRAMAGLTRSVDRLASEYAQAGRAAAASGRTMSSSFNGAAASIRKLAAEVAGLYGAFKALETAKNFVERGIEVNAKLEQARLTIASIVGALNDIRDAQGNVLKGAEKLNASEKIAAGLLEEMRVLAMETTASFTDIAQGVASIIAPATKARISISELPKFTVSAVQAMSAMGLHTMQMRTEIEALLSGNINKVQDVLATNLGITGEMVRSWQKQGTLVQELYKRLEMFNIAGVRALTTWRGLQGNMKGALDDLSAFASRDLFEKLKNAWADLIEFMVYRGKDGKLHIGKDLEGLMTLFQRIEGEIGDAIVAAVKKLMRWIADLNKPENLAAALKTWDEFKKSCVAVVDKVLEVAAAVKSVTASCTELAREVRGVVNAFNAIDRWMTAHPDITGILLDATAGAVGGGAAGGLPGAIGGALFGAAVGTGERAVRQPSRGDALRSAKARREYEGSEEYRKNMRARAGSPNLMALLGDDDGGKVSNKRLLDDLGEELGRKAGAAMAAELPKKLETKGASVGAWNPGTNLIGVGSRKLKEIPEARGAAQKEGDVIPESGGYTLTPTVEPYKPKTPKPKKPRKSKAESDAERFAERSAHYAAGLQELRNEVAALERAMQPGLTTYDRMVAKINAERDAAIANADVKAQEAIRRKECTAAQAEETAALEKRKAELEAQRQLDELQLQTLQDRANWYREFGELTGQTNQGLELQNQLIDRQALEWQALGIPMDMINERVRIMKQELATDPLSGLARGFRKLTAEGMNWAQTTEQAFSQTVDIMAQGFANFASGTKMDMADILRSWVSMLNQMLAKAIMSQLFSGIGGLLGFGGGGASASSGVSAAASAISAGVASLHAHGDAFLGISGLRNQIVYRPTLFAYGSRLSAFAQGAGLMGEAGPEAVMPLARTRSGDLGVQAAGAGGVLALSLTIVDQTEGGVGVRDAQASMDGWSMDLMVRELDGKLAGLAAAGKSKLVGAMERTHRMPSRRGWAN